MSEARERNGQHHPPHPDQPLELQAHQKHQREARERNGSARRVIGGLVALVALLGIASSSSHRPINPASPDPQSPATGASRLEAGGQTPGPAPPVIAANDPRLAVAISEPVEDSVYPQAGHPGVDTLHYDLALTWDPAGTALTGRTAVTFRSTTDAESFQLDLAAALEVSAVILDGVPVPFTHTGKDLIVAAPVRQDERYQARIEYAGTPRPVPAPSTRGDNSDGLGWHTTKTGETWTMQEPFGAYSWYPVNDQPADKALYDFTLSVPSPMVGVANGELRSRVARSGSTVTRWHLDEPAASYLITVAFGVFERTKVVSESGVPISWWTPRGDPAAQRAAGKLVGALAWAEKRLGPYPFATLGLVSVDSASAMETQTMITLGNTAYVRSDPIILHELIHQWYGDQVTPQDWRDVWMNEGMTTYLQGVYEAEKSGTPINDVMRQWSTVEAGYRRQAGPPGNYDPTQFAEVNVYFGPALMWHQLRRDIGERRFWKLVRGWPAAHDRGELSGSADRAEYYAWVEDATGEELSAFFAAWIDGRTAPRLTDSR
ncbi:MAG: M1 family metallopeptidase [Nocardioides sp.]